MSNASAQLANLTPNRYFTDADADDVVYRVTPDDVVEEHWSTVDGGSLWMTSYTDRSYLVPMPAEQALTFARNSR